MPQFTFEGPGGQQHTIEGPEGASAEDAFKILQSHLGMGQVQTPGLMKSAASGLIEGAGAPGDLSQKALGGAPPQQPIDRNTYYGQLVNTLNQARQYLELPTSQKIGNAVGMQPTQPVTGAEKAVQGAAGMLPGMALGGAPVGRAMMGAAPAANAVRGMGMAPQGPASALGGAGAAANPGDALQKNLLAAGLKEGASVAGHALGGPIGGIAARAAANYIPKVLRLEK